MSRRKYGCLICGYRFGTRNFRVSEEKWLEEFRVICSNLEGCFISGIGIWDDDADQLQAPSDPTKRCDSEDYDPSLNQVFHINFCEDGTRAFILHSACWELLKEAFQPNDVPLERFVDVCKSLPFAIGSRCFHWDHTYGGLCSISEQLKYGFLLNPYRWESQLVDLPSNSEAAKCAPENPYHIPELSSLIMETAHEPLGLERDVNYQSNDCFAKLPWEIREAIAISLPTHDALTLREASRSFIPIFDSSTFWASRFKIGSDRGFLFEKKTAAEARDWLSLYRRTNPEQRSRGVKNRIRIWSLIDHIYHLVKMSLDDGVLRLTAPIMEGDKSRVVEAAAKIVQPSEDGIYDVFSNGCQLSWLQEASIPSGLVSVGFSFVQNTAYCHLTGLSFSAEDGKVLRLGYASANTVLYSVKDLEGFVMAIDPRGIRALQIVHSNGDRSQWFGSPKNTPVTERLAIIDTTQPIRIGVDGFKIVSIGASIPADIFNGISVETSLPLRSKALWWPSVPGQEINLNEQSFIQATPLLMKYFPVEWVHFGGSQGANLRRLASVLLDNFGRSGIITFDYTQDKSRELLKTHIGAYEIPHWTNLTSYPINGPEGEQIQNVQAARRHNTICALKLITNNGEIHESGTTAPPNPIPPYPNAPMPEREAEAEFETFSIAPGTTITGFYASHYHSVFLSFGVASEVIKGEGPISK